MKDTQREFELFDLCYTKFDSMVMGGRVSPSWSPDGTAMAYVDGPPDDLRGRLVDLASGALSELVDNARIRNGIRAATGVTPPGRGLPFDRFDFVDPRTICARVGDRRIAVDLTTQLVTEISAAVAEPEPRRYWRTRPMMDPAPALETASPDGRYLASTQAGNIVLRSAYDGGEIRLTADGTAEHEWRFDAPDPRLAGLGWTGPVTNWSPDGTRLAAYKVDHRGVARVPQVHLLNGEPEVVYRYVARAGGILERSTPHLIDVYGRAPIAVDMGDPAGGYPVFAGWLPDGAAVLVVRLSRDCRRVDVLAADAATGAVRELFSESGDTFVRIHHDLYFGRKPGLWLTPDGANILWLSARDGWNHLYAYDACGRLLRQLTSGAWPVDEVVCVRGGHVYFTAHHDEKRPYDVHVCRVPVQGGRVIRLTEGEGRHEPVFPPAFPSAVSAGDFFVDIRSTPSEPPVSVLRSGDGTVRAKLSRADAAPLARIGWTPPRQFAAIAADQVTELWGVMYFPADFVATKRHPLIEYVYGGPQATAASHDWAGGLHGHPARALAQLGYVTVVLDGRGTPARSKAFHDVVYQNWAGPLVEDHAAVLEQLVERHDFIDPDRIGVIGHSWGGYSAFRLLAERPDIYRAAVASAPGFDPYSDILSECYLGLPQHNREAYERADALTWATVVDGAIMIVCGTSDLTTWPDAIKMSEALIRAGKPHEFVVLPGQGHGYDDTHTRYFWRKVGNFFGAELNAGA